MSDDKKTIRVDSAAFQIARERKESAGQTWAEYLTDDNRTSPEPSDVATEITAQLNLDASDAHDEIDVIEERIDALAEELEGAPTALGYDDVVAAQRQALREELPDGVFR